MECFLRLADDARAVLQDAQNGSRRPGVSAVSSSPAKPLHALPPACHPLLQFIAQPRIVARPNSDWHVAYAP